jgi:hypothetical protein
MDNNTLEESVKRAGQADVLRFWNELSPESRRKLGE